MSPVRDFVSGAMLASGSLLCSGGSAQAAIPANGGFYVAINPYSIADDCALKSIVGSTPSWPTYLDGIVLLIQWSAVPYNGTSGTATPTWITGNTLTCPTTGTGNTPDLAQTLGLLPAQPIPLSIALAAGEFMPNTLSAVTQPPLMAAPGILAPAVPQVASMYFTFANQTMGAPAQCVQLPLPWDANFATTYVSTMLSLGTFLFNKTYTVLGATHHRWTDVSIVKLAGIDTNSAETFLESNSNVLTSMSSNCAGTYATTSGTPATVTPNSVSAETMWGYEGFHGTSSEGPPSVETAWTTLVSGLLTPSSRYAAKLSQGGIFSIAVLNTSNFPSVNSTLTPPQLMMQLIGDVAGTSTTTPLVPSPQLAVQFNGLNECEPQPAVGTGAYADCTINAGYQFHPQLVCESNTSSTHSHTIMGWQTNGFGGVANGLRMAGCGAQRQNTSCAGSGTSQPYQDLLENGIDNNASFIEVWPSDVMQYTSQISTAHTYFLTSSHGTTCTTVNGG